MSQMAETLNLSNEMASRLPQQLVALMQSAGAMADYQGQRLYLVGGVVRDLILGRTNLDLDLVVEGDALSLAPQLASITQGKLTTHPRFGTAKLRWNEWSIDITTARSEVYDRPGALPRVKPGSLADDLFRRDFTINTLAIRLNPGRYGELVDLYGGRDDLDQGLIRVLHQKSFVDDATRIWRALRYEQRLGFRLEPVTLELLQRDIPLLDTISSERIRHELELILKEERPEKVLARAGELGVLAKLHPQLKGDGWLAQRFEQARKMGASAEVTLGLYLALLTYPLSHSQVEQFVSYLRLPRSLSQVLEDTHNLKTKLRVLANPRLRPSTVYSLLSSYSPAAITTVLLASDSPAVRHHIHLFLHKLRYIRPALRGDDLKRLGVVPGPQMREVLSRLHQARLDGQVASRRGEEELVRQWLRRQA